MKPDIVVYAVTVNEAARVAGRSVSWIRAKRNFGPLEPAIVEGRQGVTLESLAELVEQCRQHRRAKTRRHTKLRLVVDNTR